MLGLASHSTTGMAITKKLFYALDGLDFREAIDQGVKSNAEAHAQQEPHGAPRS